MSATADVNRPSAVLHPMRRARGLLTAVWQGLLARRQVQRERAQLLTLSERELRDLGISRVDAVREATKPWWRD